MKLFRQKETGEIFFAPGDNSDLLMKFDGSIIVGEFNVEEVDTNPRNHNYRRLHVVEDSFSFGCDDVEWHENDKVFIPVGNEVIPFSVKHISDEKVYFVADRSVGESSMDDMDKFLDDFLDKMPKDLVDVMCEMEHKIDGRLVRKSKLTLLSRGNVTKDYRRCNGADDIPFCGMLTEAERCRNNADGETVWYWLDTTSERSPIAGNSAGFMFVSYVGYPNYYYNASSASGVVPCFSIRKKRKATCRK